MAEWELRQRHKIWTQDGPIAYNTAHFYLMTLRITELSDGRLTFDCLMLHWLISNQYSETFIMHQQWIAYKIPSEQQEFAINADLIEQTFLVAIPRILFFYVPYLLNEL